MQRARRERGLSLREVEDATKIRTRYLDGLEREDFSVLPDAVYVQGFLKTYANFLGLDGDTLVREFRNRRFPRRERQPDQGRYRRSELEKPIVAPGGLAGAQKRRVSGTTILTVALAVLILAAVIGFLYLIGSRASNTPTASETPPPPRADKLEQPAQPDSPAQPKEAPREKPREEPREEPRKPAPPAEETPPPPSEEPAAGTVTVTVSVPSVPVGLTVRADGQVVADVFAQPGYAQTFEAREAVIVETGNAGAVAVEVDGEDQGYLGSYGQPVTRAFGSVTSG